MALKLIDNAVLSSADKAYRGQTPHVHLQSAAMVFFPRAHRCAFPRIGDTT